ncbi:MAG TPA: ribonuclease domain-containing protein [Hanamia sp.]
MKTNYTQLILGIIIGLLIGIFIGKQISGTSQSQIAITPTASQSSPSPDGNAVTTNLNEGENSNPEIPQKGYDVLKYIRANHHSMPGYVGGRAFSNREKIVPQFDDKGNPIKYQEWDVNPKIEGQNRGTDRILTGSDGRAWYTDDHYKSFKEIK